MNLHKLAPLHRHVLLSTTVLVSAFAAYSRSAYAACVNNGGSTYQCSGAETATQTITANNAAVSTVPGFSVDTTETSGNAITITGDGALSYTDVNQSPLRAADTALFIESTGDIGGGNIGSVTVDVNGDLYGVAHGIRAYNSGTGAINITTRGDVSGRYESGIVASDFSSGGDINVITSVDTLVSGADFGIDVRNWGTGAATVTANGDVTATQSDAIRVVNRGATSDIAVTTGVGTTIDGDNNGIYTRNYGTGATNIRVYGDIIAEDFYGINVQNRVATTTTLTVFTGADSSVTGRSNGIYARNAGTGALTVTVNGDVTATSAYSTGISAQNNTGNTGYPSYTNYGVGTDVTVTTGAGTTVAGGLVGIRARNFGSGELTITANGDVTTTRHTGNYGLIYAGIYAYTSSTATNLTITATNVIGGEGIQAVHYGSGSVNISSTGTVTGAGDDGIDARTFGGTDLTIEVFNATGQDDGVAAIHGGSGVLSITATGLVTGISDDAIYARNNSGTDLRITAANLSAFDDGVDARHFGSGNLIINAYGIVTADSNGDETSHGIEATNDSADVESVTIVTVGGDANVAGEAAGIRIQSTTGRNATIDNAGIIRNISGATDDAAIVSTTAGDVEINNDGTIIGTVTLGDGNDTFNEQSFNSWHTAGGTNDFGAGANVINNDGLIVAAEPGALAPVLTIFQATGGTLTFNSNSGGVLALSNGVVGDVAQIGNDGEFNGTFVANGGIVTLDTEFGGDSSPTDRLVINGDTVLGTGATRLDVNNVGGLGGQTVEGIRIVEVTGTSAGGAFTLLGDYVVAGEQVVVGGAYLYRLYQGSVTEPTDGQWYLRSSGELQAGAPLYEVYANVLQGFNQLDTLQQRVGNRAWGDDVIEGEGIWGRVKATHGRFDPSTSTTGADYQVSIWELQAGVDGVLVDGDAGQLVAGVNVRAGMLDADIASEIGSGTIGGTGFGLGGTLTWYSDTGFYLDGQAQVSWYDSTLTSSTADRVLVEGNDGFGYGVSLEAGQKIALGPNWSLTPQAQLAYSEVDFADFTDSFGSAVSLNHSRSLRGRLGISADFEDSWQDDAGETSHTHLYAIANLYYDFAGAAETDLGAVTLASQNDPLRGGVGIGGTYSWGDDKYALHGQALVNTSLANPGSNLAFTGTAGLKVKW